MKTFKNIYDFYKLPKRDRMHLIDQCVRSRHDSLYFPILLTKDEFNYGIQQGLICITNLVIFNKKIHFNVCAVSPDDLDKQITFNVSDIDAGEKLRKSIFKFIKNQNKRNVTYEEFLLNIKNNFQNEQHSTYGLGE
jgi:hypothetical protein